MDGVISWKEVSVHETCYQSGRVTVNEAWRLLLKTAIASRFLKVSLTSFEIPSISHLLIEIAV